MSSQPDTSKLMPRADTLWRFGPFTVRESERRVDRDGMPVRLGSRSFDILIQLLWRAGEVVSKEELLQAVWPGVLVDEGSVRVHISSLRKAFADSSSKPDSADWILNVPSKGYTFTGRVERGMVAEVTHHALPNEPLRVAGFVAPPLSLTQLMGRDTDVDKALAALADRRLVSVVGSGGIGKSRLALRVTEVYRTRDANRPRSVAFADLAPLVSGDHVFSTLARSLGVPIEEADTFRLLQSRIAGTHLLLLIDNCEHVLEALAPLVMRLLVALPGLRILATSREALQVEGEFVLRLSPLDVPAAAHTSLAVALQSSAVRLLVERAEAAGAQPFDDSHAPALSQVSRYLDGIPLAIELVAGRLCVQSVDDLLLRLDDHMGLYMEGNRASMPRHRTLAAALDWSVALLSPEEMRLFRRLSVFRGRFDVEAALSMVADEPDSDLSLQALIGLTEKSLISFDRSEPSARYRLLDTTRSYAAKLLMELGEKEVAIERHAMQMLDVMNAATEDLSVLTVARWNEQYAHWLDDVRFAIDQCFVRGAVKAASALSVASAPLWFHVFQLNEFRQRLALALQSLEAEQHPDSETMTWLRVALTNAILHTVGPVPEMGQVGERASAGAYASQSPILLVQARWGMCFFDVCRGDYAAGLRHAHALRDHTAAWADPIGVNLSHRMLALTSHFAGDFVAAQLHGQRALSVVGGAKRVRGNMLQVDANVASNAILARTLWIKGHPAQSHAASAEAIRSALATGQALSLCFALFGACPVAIWSGNLDQAREYVQMMIDEAEQRGLVYWNRWARCFAEGLAGMAPMLSEDRPLQKPRAWAAMEDPQKETLLTFCPDYVDDAMIARAWHGQGQWAAAEVYRAAGLRHERHGAFEEARSLYLRALALARRQGARVWEMRASISLANLLGERDDLAAARRVLDEALQGYAPQDEFPERLLAQKILASPSNS